MGSFWNNCVSGHTVNAMAGRRRQFNIPRVGQRVFQGSLHLYWLHHITAHRIVTTHIWPHNLTYTWPPKAQERCERSEKVWLPVRHFVKRIVVELCEWVRESREWWVWEEVEIAGCGVEVTGRGWKLLGWHACDGCQSLWLSPWNLQDLKKMNGGYCPDRFWPLSGIFIRTMCQFQKEY